MGKKIGGKVKPAPEAPATVEEIRGAYVALTPAELLKLEKYSMWKTRGLERMGGPEFSADSLFGEAMMRTLDGSKNWYKSKVSFFVFFHGAMKNIAGHWHTHLKSRNASFEAQNKRLNYRDGEPDPMDVLPAGGRSAEDVLIDAEDAAYASDFIAQIKTKFSDDQLALDVLDGWSAGMTPKEIQDILGIQRRDFETVQRRLTRAIDETRDRGGVNE